MLYEIHKEGGKEFENTKFSKGGGSCFECCDYENMYIELKSHNTKREIALLEGVIKKCEEMNNFRQFICNEEGYFPAKQDWNLATEQCTKKNDAFISYLQEEIKKIQNEKN